MSWNRYSWPSINWLYGDASGANPSGVPCAPPDSHLSATSRPLGSIHAVPYGSVIASSVSCAIVSIVDSASGLPSGSEPGGGVNSTRGSGIGTYTVGPWPRSNSEW